MPLEQAPTSPSIRLEAALPLADDAPHPGCNCGRRRRPSAPLPLLRDDLVIVARDRAREPELPEATVSHALATPMAPRPARYDLIILGSDPRFAERDNRIATEFARHEHRVFHLADHGDALGGPTAPMLHRLSRPAGLGQASDILTYLAELRHRENIGTAVILAPSGLDPVVARGARGRWNWRVATTVDAPSALRAATDIRIDFAADHCAGENSPEAAISPDQSWPARWTELDRAFRSAWPRASVIVLTHDNLAFNRMCLTSVLENTDYPNFEIIIVDNASTDGTVEELQRLAVLTPNVRVILNDHNAGFGPANNQGLAAASGNILVLLNNDTIVPRGWLTRLARHLDDPRVGMIGPGTNRTCNEAQLDIPYQTYAEFQEAARVQGARHDGEHYAIRMPMMFCTAFRRETYERVGPLDERFETGLFEDEDYALRVRNAGLELVWTPEVFVHHAYHATVGKLLPTGEYMRLVNQNRGRFEEKWGISWERHRPAPLPPA